MPRTSQSNERVGASDPESILDQVMAARIPGILDECAKLARKAEWWGSEGKGERLAALAMYLSEGDYLSAMSVRDDILCASRKARSETVGGIMVAALYAIAVLLPPALLTYGYIEAANPILLVCGSILYCYVVYRLFFYDRQRAESRRWLSSVDWGLVVIFLMIVTQFLIGMARKAGWII